MRQHPCSPSYSSTSAVGTNLGEVEASLYEVGPLRKGCFYMEFKMRRLEWMVLRSRRRERRVGQGVVNSCEVLVMIGCGISSEMV
jgi:hypothetical protein